MKEFKGVLVPEAVLLQKIFVINGVKVMLDLDLAQLYRVETKRLNEKVKRNIDRFPEDFMFQLTQRKWEDLKSQNATSIWGGRRTLPYAFTKQSAAMLSSVLNSKVAIQVNIQIIRIFTKMRELLLTNKDILLKLEKIEKQVGQNSQDINTLFHALKKAINYIQTKKGTHWLQAIGQKQ